MRLYSQILKISVGAALGLVAAHQLARIRARMQGNEELSSLEKLFRDFQRSRRDSKDASAQTGDGSA